MAEWPSGLGKGLQSPVRGFDSRFRLGGRLAQRESASLTRKRSLVQSQYRPRDQTIFFEYVLVDMAAPYALTGDQIREWALLGRCALIDTDKYHVAPSRRTRQHLGAVLGCYRRAAPVARPVSGARPRAPQPAPATDATIAVWTSQTCAPLRTQAQTCSPRSAPPLRGGARPNLPRRWPGASPAFSRHKPHHQKAGHHLPLACASRHGPIRSNSSPASAPAVIASSAKSAA